MIKGDKIRKLIEESRNIAELSIKFVNAKGIDFSVEDKTEGGEAEEQLNKLLSTVEWDQVKKLKVKFKDGKKEIIEFDQGKDAADEEENEDETPAAVEEDQDDDVDDIANVAGDVGDVHNQQNIYQSVKENSVLPTTHHVYDYIIIGAGTAGGIIAKELTDDKCTSVLVLEAGTNMVAALSDPSRIVAGVLSTNNKFSFNVMSTLEAAIGRSLRYSGGRAIGGSSEHNGMVAVRGSRQLFDEWADLVGPQWSNRELEPLFKFNETYTGLTQNPDSRGRNGPTFVRQQIVPQGGGICATFAQAASEVLNVPLVEDYNTGIKDCSFVKWQVLNKRVGTRFVRSSTATGYLDETVVTQGNEFSPDEFGVNGRQLIILAKTTVDKVLFNQRRGQNIAVGVQFVRDGITQRAFAKKGVIVSAGMLTPTILQRSGIGRSTDLANAGISTIVESPNVGHLFQCHFSSGMGIEVETSRLQAVLNADPAAPSVGGAFRGRGTQDQGRRLQLFTNALPGSVPIQFVQANNWGFNPAKPTNVMSISITDNRPTSRGSVVVAHSDPEAMPSVNFNPLGDPDDLNFMIDSYIDTYNIVVRMRQLDPNGIYKVVFPPENIFQIPNVQEKRNLLAQFIRSAYQNSFHYAGLCRMANSIQEGVVDGFLNVFGTKNLKVADISVAPINTDGNTSIPSQIVGLNAARFLIQEQCNAHVCDDTDFADYEER